MDKLLEEFNRSKGMVLTLESCGYQLRTCLGLPCAQELVTYVSSGLLIPLDSVDAFWRKLDFSPSICVKYGDLNCDHDMQRFKEVFNNHPDNGKSNFLRRLRGIIDPSKISIGEPLVKKKKRGCPKAKHVDHQAQVPHRHNCSDLNQEPPRHSSFFMDMNEESARHSSFFMNVDFNQEPMGQCSNQYDLNSEPIGECSNSFDLNSEPVGKGSNLFDLNSEPIGECSNPFDLNSEPIGECSNLFDLNEEPPAGHGSLLKEIPEIFHPYITGIQDVSGDGNCGFRSIAVCLGIGEDRWLYVREQLLNELMSSYDAYARVYTNVINELLHCVPQNHQHHKHWMIMPLTNVLIANTFGVILYFLSNTMSITCFPFWKGPEDFQYYRVLTVAHVYDNHYVMVQLEEKYPMPPIMGLWIRNKAPSKAA